MEVRLQPIETIGLSTRSFNALQKAGVQTVGDMLGHTEESLSHIRNLGRKSIDEILSKIEKYKKIDNGEEPCGSEKTSGSEKPDKHVINIFTDLLGIPKYRERILLYVKAHNSSVKKLGFTIGTVNTLNESGFYHLSDLIFLSQSDLMNLPRIGSVASEKILAKVREYLSSHADDILASCSEDGVKLNYDIVIREKILGLYKDKAFCGLSFKEIADRVQLQEPVSEERLKKVIGVMLAGRELEYVDFRCYRVYGKFSDYLDKCDCIDERSKTFIRRRLAGDTLEAIGDDFGLTRERVRQIAEKGVKKICIWYRKTTGMEKFDEDYYQYFYETYDFDKHDAGEWFGMQPAICNYLSMRYKSGKSKDLQKALDDYHNLDMGLRLKIKNFLNRNKLFIDGQWIDRRRADLEEAVVRKCCADDVSFSNFIDIFNNFLKKQGVEYDDGLYYTKAVYSTRKSRLSESRFILWKLNEMMRYYDIDAHDFTELLDALNLNAYENIEFSTAKFMRAYPDIMKKYDIRDQYELHNLLRKIVREGSYHDFHCGRMPTIRFGEFNRKNAVLDILIDNAPISRDDLCGIIQEEFGVDAGIAIANYLQPFNDYYHNGVYTIDDKIMPMERRERLLAELTEDFYFIAEIRDFYSKLFPEADPEEVNPYNLKSMGFNVLSRYVLKRYSSLDDYFKALLASDNEVYLVPLRKRFGYVHSFYSTLMEMKKSLQVVEFEPNRIMSFHVLEKRGLTLEKVRHYCDLVFAFVENGSYFSICSLKNSGFEAELFDLGFSDWFYANLLLSDERFSSCKMLGNIIIHKGQENISIRSFATHCIERHGSISVNDLISELNARFGCKISERSDVLQKIADSSVYYDKIMDRLFANPEIYYRELAAEGI